MSFLKRLFGRSSPAAQPAEIGGQTIVHEGYSITATPMPADGQFRLSATIEKEIGGGMKSHRLIRADLFPSREAAETAALVKAKRVIDEQGETLFD